MKVLLDLFGQIYRRPWQRLYVVALALWSLVFFETMNKSKSPTFFLLNFVLNRLKLFSGTSVHNVLFIQNIKETLLQSFWDKSFCNPINLLINVTVNTPYFPRLIEITSWWRRKWSTSLELIWVALSSHWIRTWSGSLQE